MNKKKYFSCKNCTSKTKVTFANKVIFCFGLIKKVEIPKDYYRFCIIKRNKKSSNDVMLEELYAMLRGLSQILFEKRLIDINKKHKKNANK